MKSLTFTVTNNLQYDQRMIRICGTLADKGYQVTLIGVRNGQGEPLPPRPFRQNRIKCIFGKGFGFYAEYNLRLFFFLLFHKTDLICAIDLDTIIPAYFVSLLRKIPRVYDAHELFCEMKEVVTRPAVYRVWKTIERIFVPRFRFGYTVSEPIAEIFQKEYKVNYQTIRNMPLRSGPAKQVKRKDHLLYQGAVNEGRSFETLIPAMQWVNAPLHIYGDGNFLEQTRGLINKHNLTQKVFLKGKKNPEELKLITAEAKAGITLFENNGLSNYYSLANRFFDYIQAETPQLCVNYPAYQAINLKYGVALMIEDLSPESIAAHLNNLIEDEVLYKKLQLQCSAAAGQLNWEEEEKKLIEIYQQIFA